MSTELYPLKFVPILKQRIWAGNRLQNYLQAVNDSKQHIGESWEISGLQGDISIVKNGYLKGNNLQEIIEIYMGDILGDKIYSKFGHEFPLLIKIIDTASDLSVQVHPGDELARERHNAYGKTEMWFILEASDESLVHTGFAQDTDIETYRKSLVDNNIKKLLNEERPEHGDVFFTPAGRIHAIGKDITLVEIQQTSDITYRISDYGRPGLDGKPRELHTLLAEEAIEFKKSTNHYTKPAYLKNKAVNLLDCKHFVTNHFDLDRAISRDYSLINSFKIFICTRGAFRIVAEDKTTDVSCGESILLPAVFEGVVIETSDAELLEIYIDPGKL